MNIKENKEGIFLILLAFLIGILNVIYMPEWKGPLLLKETYTLFGLSLVSFILILAIAGFLYHRWAITGKKNKTTLIWTFSFALYSIVFLGLMLQSLGIAWADQKNPAIFFLFRQLMIFFVFGMYSGVSRILTESKFWTKYLAGLILVFSYLVFVYGLFIKDSIEFTMYLFLSFIFIPACFLIAFLFYKYGKLENLFSMKLLASGFIFLGLTYAGWAPFHKDYFYFVMFFLFTISLSVILTAFIYLSLAKTVEEKKKTIPKKEKTKKKIN